MSVLLPDLSYPPARVFLHDGDGRRRVELKDCFGNRTYQTMSVGRAIYTLPEDSPHLDLLDPREGRLLVIESSIYDQMWVGQLRDVSYDPAKREFQLEAESYETVLQERFLPSTFSATGAAAGELFRAVWEAIEAINSSGIKLYTETVTKGLLYQDTNYADRSQFEAWNSIAKNTMHEWWLSYGMVGGKLEVTGHFRADRGSDNSQISLSVGPYSQLRVNNSRISMQASPHRMRVIGGSTSPTQGFSERTRVERRNSRAYPTADAPTVTAQYTRHGFVFDKWPTGQNALTRAEAILILESVQGQDSLTTAAESNLVRGRTSQRMIDLEIHGYPQLWSYCQPGDVVSLMLPPPYFLKGYVGPAAVVSCQPMEHLGIHHVVMELPNAD